MQSKLRTIVILGAVWLLTMIHGCDGEPGEGVRCTSGDDYCDDTCDSDYTRCTTECYGQPGGCDHCEREYDNCEEDCSGKAGMQCEDHGPDDPVFE